MTIVTPSKWLCGLVKESFLQQYCVKVINNGIDLNIFKPTNDEFRKKNHLDNRKIVLGVASVWGKNKGLDVFYRLANELPDEYIVVLVVTNHISTVVCHRILSESIEQTIKNSLQISILVLMFLLIQHWKIIFLQSI